MNRFRPTATQKDLFGLIRIAFGVIWVINVLLQARSAYLNHFLSYFTPRVAGQPAFIQHYLQWMISLITAIGPKWVALATVVLDTLIALSLLTGVAGRLFAGIGALYCLWLWTTVGGWGGPYTAGATDPGTAIVYVLVFICILLTRAWERYSLLPAASGGSVGISRSTIRLLFGALWAFDAYWKWQPYFIHHVQDYLVQAQAGQPAWIRAYIQLFVDVVHATGSVAFGVFTAAVETLIALSLLTGRWLKLFLPLGIAWSLAVWTTAEGWGGPYSPGQTGNRGDMVGSVNIYIFVFLYLMVLYGSSRAGSAAQRLKS